MVYNFNLVAVKKLTLVLPCRIFEPKLFKKIVSNSHKTFQLILLAHLPTWRNPIGQEVLR